jgi:hypothetical protein
LGSARMKKVMENEEMKSRENSTREINTVQGDEE